MRNGQKINLVVLKSVAVILFLILASYTVSAECGEPDPDEPKVNIEFTPEEVIDGMPVYFITETPTMPTIDFKAVVTGANPDPNRQFSWTAHLTYSWASRYWDPNAGKSGKGAYVPFIDSKDFTFQSDGTTGDSWTPIFQDSPGNDIIMGGTLYVTVTTIINGKEYYDAREIQILGKNPNKEVIKAELEVIGKDEVKDPMYQILAYRETVVDKGTWMQFSIGPEEGDNPVGEPTYGKPSGYGLMKLDPASYKQLWNWKENVKAGEKHFKWRLTEAQQIPSKVRTYYKGKEPVIDFSDDQILRQAYYAYNAGDATMDNAYYAWDVDNDVWIENSKAHPDGVAYADAAMNNYYAIVNNNPLPYW